MGACLQECLNSKSISSLPATASPLWQHEHLLSTASPATASALFQQIDINRHVYIYIYITKHTRNHIRNSAPPNTHPDDKRKMRTNKQKSQAQPGSETDRFIV